MLVGEVRLRDLPPRLLLEVIGREPLVVRSDERVEEEPGPARQQTEAPGIAVRQRRRAPAPWPADGGRDLGRDEPEDRERKRRRERGRPAGREQRQRADRDQPEP